MKEDADLQDQTKAIIEEPIASLFPREACQTSPSEKPRSAQLSRLLQAEFSASPDVEFVHQFPIVPTDKVNEQDVDVACIAKTHQGTAIACSIVYKPTMEFVGFRTQTAVYATDTMSATNRPCIAVQIRGMTMDNLEIRAYGVVINLHKKPSHALSLLLSGGGMPGLKQLISGLRSYLEHFPKEDPGQWHQGYLSSVVSLHSAEATVYKAYDYRPRGHYIGHDDRRQPNIALVKKFVDPNAQLTSFGSDFHLVSTHFWQRQDSKAWYGPVMPAKLAKIVSQLNDLHEKNQMVHGDVRLRNMILHEGVLTDYDFSKAQGSLYPSTLLEIHTDGIRHPDVLDAIKQQERFEKEDQNNHHGPDDFVNRIEKLQMEYNHDIYAMKYVLGMFKPLDTSLLTRWQTIVEVDDLCAMIEPLTKFPSEVEFSEDLGCDCKPTEGTGSPPFQ